MKKRGKLNSKMRDIILALHRRGGAMTTHEISKETGISYVTVKKYLKDLSKKGIIKRVGVFNEAYEENI